MLMKGLYKNNTINSTPKEGFLYRVFHEWYEPGGMKMQPTMHLQR
jgi:hypothetical protein